METSSSWIQRIARIRQTNQPKDFSVADKIKELKEANRSCQKCRSRRIRGLMFVCAKKDTFIKNYNICEKFEEITTFNGE